jgi:response regulator RpfG family c-di-GMP phosphodiesterase
MTPKILIVDDEQYILESFYRFCKIRKWTAFTSNSCLEALDILQKESIDIIISDMRMPEMDGVTFLTKAKALSPQSIRILLTGYADMKAVENAVNEAKVYSYLSKPWDDQMLESVINSAADFKAKENERLRLIDEIACKKKN